MLKLNEQAQRPAFIVGKCNEYLKRISDITGRNVIAYYSGWLKSNNQEVSINENDKNAFMNAVFKMDRSKGVDLIVHTPGGNIAATESIVGYLKGLFKNDMRAIIPQISMSAGTMIAMACKEIIMGKQSALGPIDPQMNGYAAQMVVEEFYHAAEEIKQKPETAFLWQKIVEKYPVTFLTQCQDAISWSEHLAEIWLKDVNVGIDMKKVKNTFINHKHSYSHSRHFSKEHCLEAGLNVTNLEDNQDLQDAVLSLHHSFMILFDITGILKIVMNQDGRNYIRALKK